MTGAGNRPDDEGGPPDRTEQPHHGHRTFLLIAAVLVAVAAAVVVGLLAWAGQDGGDAPPPSGLAVPTDEPARTADAGAPTTADRPARTRPTQPATSTGLGAPTSIRIEGGGVDGPLVPQGLSPDGTINPGRNQVIWFTGGDRVAPGETGTAVVAAHVTWDGAPDAFARLPEVRVGEVVTVGYDDGSSRSFTVTETAAVAKEDLARSLTVWGPHPRTPRLAIITCDPTLGFGADGHTEANFVVIAEG